LHKPILPQENTCAEKCEGLKQKNHAHSIKGLRGFESIFN
jgi:predicted nucleic acid-binding Zn ribbon protein